MKSIKSLASTTIVVILAIGAAFATTPIENDTFDFPTGAGYSANEHNHLVPEEDRVPFEIQSHLCLFRRVCAGGDFPCRVIVAGEVYGIYSPSTTCQILLGEPAP
jgi:hypothetical protein